MIQDAIIGHTGFIGGTLLRQHSTSATYNSRNIESVRGRKFDRVFCAGVSAAKWLANQDPDQDWGAIVRLMACLDDIEAGHFVLISTVDVYRDTVGQTERDVPQTEGLHAYGRHRLRLEQFVAERFPAHSIVRLPALFGRGLKKNALYDLTHLNQIDRITPNAAYQWYPIRRLSDDLGQIIEAGVSLINITSEPIQMDEIRIRFFPGLAIGDRTASPPLYDLRTVHAELLGGRGGYHLDAEAVMDEMGVFIDQMRE